MAVVVLAAVVAVVAGLATGGSLRALSWLPVARAELLGLAVVVAVLGWLASPLYVAATGVSALLLLAFLIFNRGLAGVGLLTLGLALNAAVVLANGAMPVSDRALRSAGVDRAAYLDDPRHEAEDSGTRLRALADVVPVRLPLVPVVVSPGDIAVAAGAALLLFAGTRRREVEAPRPALPAGDGPPDSPNVRVIDLRDAPAREVDRGPLVRPAGRRERGGGELQQVLSGPRSQPSEQGADDLDADDAPWWVGSPRG